MRRKRTLIVAAVSCWLCIVLLCIKMAPPAFYGDDDVDFRVARLQQELQALQQEKTELLKLVVDIRNDPIRNISTENNLVPLRESEPDISSNKEKQEFSSTVLTSEGEHVRRKAENTVTELWYFIDSLLMQSSTEEGHKSPTLYELRDSLKGYKRTMMSDFEKLRNANKADIYREQRLQELGDLIQRRFQYLQNPSDCDNAKKLVCRLNKECGFGCQLHHVVHCMITAYALERTLILKSDRWQYEARGFEAVFEPISLSCVSMTTEENISDWPVVLEYMTNKNTLYLKYDEVYSPPSPSFLPPSVPADMAQELSTLHGNPSVWWIGQIVRYIFRLKPEVLQEVIRRGEDAGFTSIIVGVHIRRTDKLISEASFHSVEEYMHHVEDYYDQLEQTHPGVTRRVYLATDEPSVLSEANEKYPAYVFINDFNISQSATSVEDRYSRKSLDGVITDVYFLSRCDYLVCTFSSGVCRMAYELMQTLHGDASRNFRSLDDIYYFGGQNGHNLTAVEEYHVNIEGHIELMPGDVISIAGNHWDGFSKGLNLRTNRTGLFPSYKAEDTVVAADMPTYPQVPLKSNDNTQPINILQKPNV